MIFRVKYPVTVYFNNNYYKDYLEELAYGTYF